MSDYTMTSQARGKMPLTSPARDVYHEIVRGGDESQDHLRLFFEMDAVFREKNSSRFHNKYMFNDLQSYSVRCVGSYLCQRETSLQGNKGKCMMHTGNGSKSQASTVRLVDEISQWWKTSLHKAQIGEVASVPEAEAEAGDDMTSTAGRIIFQVVDNRGFQDFGVDVDHMVIVGRTDRETRLIPDVDLTPYGALDHGVSRQHAVILPTDEGLCLIDLDSSNGTALNDKRVAPGQKHILRSGDRLTFGTLRLIVRVSHSLRRGRGSSATNVTPPAPVP